VSDDRVTKAADLTLRESVWPIALVTVLFFLWGFSYGLLDTLNKHFQVTLHIDRARSAGLQAAYFGFVSMTVFHLVISNNGTLIAPILSLLSATPRGSYDTIPTRLFSSGDSVSMLSVPLLRFHVSKQSPLEVFVLPSSSSAMVLDLLRQLPTLLSLVSLYSGSPPTMLDMTRWKTVIETNPK